MPIPLSLYIHFPWCIAKCPYCDFNSHPKQGALPEQEYLQTLLDDLRADAPLVSGRNIETIFIGGGTPSLMQPSTIAAVIEAAKQSVGFADDVEITMEANPGAIEHHSFEGYLSAGVNRLSLGVQSFDDGHLQRLGRVHDSTAAFTAYRDARAAGFDNINLDIMYGLPGQTLSGALADVDQVVELLPEHISHYHLTMEAGTAFGRQPPKDLPDDDLSWQMLNEAQQRLASAGYDRYEVSAYARDGRQCRHNLNYWRYGDYLGIGAGAHGKVTHADGAITRTVKKNKPAAFIREQVSAATKPDACTTRTDVLPEDAGFEFMLNNLRLTAGFSLRELQERCPEAGPLVMQQIQAAVQKNLLEQIDSSNYRPTDLGMRFLDDLQAMFLPAEKP